MVYLREIFILLFYSFFLQYAQAQITIKGRVADLAGKPVSGANIVLSKQRNGPAHAFAIADASGNYLLNYASENPITDSLFLQVNALGFRKTIIPLNLSRNIVNFALEPITDMLPNVSVTNNQRMLKVSGDTLSFNVSSFTSPQDRVIGDIIKKLPGIEMDNDGKIYYQGKPINRFLIDGANLLDGRYNIATGAVPTDMVDKVQVLENHQPIQALKNVSFSDNAAVNIVLKDKARLKIIGTGDAAVGLPDLYNTTLHLMQFNKKIKLIDYYKLNNNGHDLHKELINHNLGEPNNENTYPVQLLNFGAATPPLSKNRFLFNNSGLANINQHITLKNAQELKFNAFYLHNREFVMNNFNSSFYLPNDTIRFFEQKNARLHEDFYNVQLAYSNNHPRFYLANKFSLEHSKRQAYGSINGNIGNNIVQQLLSNTTQIKNELRYTNISRRSGIVTDIYSILNLIQNPAHLSVIPGLHNNIFNNGNPYNGLHQSANVPTLYTQQYISLKKPGKLKQSYTMGIQYEDKDVTTLLEAIQPTGNVQPVSDSFRNQLQWKRYTFYIEPKLSWSNKSLQIELSTPLSYQSTRFKSLLSGTHSNTALPFTPNALISYTASNAHIFSIIYRSDFNNGNIKDVYDGYTMLSYRTYGANNANLLPTQKSASTQFSYNFKNPIKMFFVTLIAGHSTVKNNTIDQQAFNALLQKTIRTPFVNDLYSNHASLSISKHLFILRSTLSTKIGVQQTTAYQLQNNSLFRYRNNSISYSANINTRFNSWLNTVYSFTKTHFTNLLPDKQSNDKTTTSQQVSNMRQELKLNLIPHKQWLMNLTGEFYTARLSPLAPNRFCFIDFSAIYKWNKLRTDIDFSVTNITNEKKYATVSTSVNSILEQSYTIRPRMLLLKFLFRF